MLKVVLEEFKENRFVSILLLIILSLALFIRVYRLDQLLGFYYDQGRDALVIWDLIHKGKLFLIGPTTGIAGVFRGPWYYWLITPFYFLGLGDPVWPAVFLAITTVVALYLLYKLGKTIGGVETGILAAILGSFSVAFVFAARWLSNPTPMFLISMVLIYALYLVTQGKNWAWIVVGLSLGMAMQFGSAAEIFYFPSVLLFGLLHKKYWPDLKILSLSLACIFITFLPQIIFDVRYHGILTDNIKTFLFSKGSFKLSFWEVIKIRLPFYYDLVVNKIFPNDKSFGKPFLILIFVSLIINFKKLWTNELFRFLLFLVFLPLVGMLFFQGNEGNVYDYYFTGYYFIYILFLSILIANFLPGRFGIILTSFFLLIFLGQNVPFVVGYIKTDIDAENVIVLGGQKQIVNWVYGDAKSRNFNVDVYVPPVISYAYDYLFKWIGTEKYRRMPLVESTSLLYTVHEVDNSHPERLQVWLARQKGIGEIKTSQSFGGITVDRRQRILYENK